jgi:hypothetical protein
MKASDTHDSLHIPDAQRLVEKLVVLLTGKEAVSEV